MDKLKVTLTEEAETLLILVCSRARESQKPDPILHDPRAVELYERLDYDFESLKVPHQTHITTCMRAKQIDTWVRDFLGAHPGGVVIHCGCGLDTRFDRVDDGQAEWFDLDLPEVIDLRQNFFEETGRYHMLASSVTDLEWVDQIPTGRPVMVVAEGLFMYLPEEDLRALVTKLAEAFPGCELAFDAFSTLTARNVGRHPSLRKTGAQIHWGLDDPHTLETWAEGIALLEEWFFTQSEDIAKVGAYSRMMFRIAGMFSMARRAHRLLRYRLG
jgi:O-methyltransferase involved in polyketide biosynthesis